MAGIAIRFSTKDITNAECLKVKPFIDNDELSSKEVGDFLYKVQELIKGKVKYVRHDIEENDILYINGFSEKNEEIFFIINLVKQWDGSRSAFATFIGNCIHTIYTADEIENLGLTSEEKREEYEKEARKRYGNADSVYERYSSKGVKCLFSMSEVMSRVSSSNDNSDENINSLEQKLNWDHLGESKLTERRTLQGDFQEVLDKLFTGFKLCNHTDKKTVFLVRIIEFYEKYAMFDNSPLEFIQGEVNKYEQKTGGKVDLDIQDAINKYNEKSDLTLNKFVAYYLGKSEPAVSRTMKTFKEKIGDNNE